MLARRSGAHGEDLESQAGQVVRERATAEPEQVDHGQMVQPHRRQKLLQPGVDRPVRDSEIQQSARSEYAPGFPKGKEGIPEVVQDVDEGHRIGRLICQRARRPDQGVGF